MAIKEKLIEYKNKTVKFCKEHKTGIICGVSAAAGFIFACAIRKSIADNTNRTLDEYISSLNSRDYDDPEIDFSELETGDDEDFDIVEQYDWNDDTHSNNWKWIKKCAEHLELEDGEWYSFENNNSHNDGLPVGETQIFHGLEPFGRDDVYPDDELEDEEDDNSDIEIVKDDANLLSNDHYYHNFYEVLDFARGLKLDDDESYIIENSDDGRTMISLRRKRD